jgi:hypothetical protein
MKICKEICLLAQIGLWFFIQISAWDMSPTKFATYKKILVGDIAQRRTRLT